MTHRIVLLISFEAILAPFLERNRIEFFLVLVHMLLIVCLLEQRWNGQDASMVVDTTLRSSCSSAQLKFAFLNIDCVCCVTNITYADLTGIVNASGLSFAIMDA